MSRYERKPRHGAKERGNLSRPTNQRLVGETKVKSAMRYRKQPRIAQGGEVRKHAGVVEPEVLVVRMQLDARDAHRKRKLPLHEPVGYKGLPSTEEGRQWVEKMLDLISYMKKSKWAVRIAKMTVQEDGDIVMIPVEGREHFIFGRPENAPEKFARMQEYLKRIKPAVEDDYYATVNIKYKGQIICRK